ncbi:MAG: GNAT family N-acetyltransferase [Terracidiphilus sp.]|jgi:predicted N-acetyltransferase YhbS
MTQKASSTLNSSPSIRIRPATAADRAHLISLINAAFGIETFLEGTRTDEERLAAMMQTGEILAAEDDAGQLLGCVYTEVRGTLGYLGQLAVDPAHQGKGLARRLMTAGEEHLRRRGCSAVEITVLNLRPELPPLYRRLGFVETGTAEAHLARTLKPGAECHFIVMMKGL